MKTTTGAQLLVERLNPTIGGVVRGLDLHRPLGPSTVAEFHQALLERKVIFIKGANVDEGGFERLGRYFGDLLDHPTLPKLPENPYINPVDSGHGTDGTSRWHFGGPWREDPFIIELLQLKVVPTAGGDTEWADLALAYAHLSDPIRQLVDRLTAVYVASPSQYSPTTLHAAFDAEQRVRHPLVITHPETGRRSLYLHTGIAEIEQLTAAETAALLAFLFAHASSRQFSVRYHWQPGDIAIWDNRAVWHAAIHDYGAEKRLGWHISVVDTAWRPSRD